MADTTLLSKRNLSMAGGDAVVGLLAIFALFFLGSDPDEVDLSAALADVEQPAADADAPAAAVDVDPQGTWAVDTTTVPFAFDDSAGTFLGFRIDEELTTAGNTTAVGRTADVTGSMTIDGQFLTEATFSGDLSTLVTDVSRRDNRTRQALQAAAFPQTTFTLTEPLDLGSAPEVGQQVDAVAVGELTIAGTTNTVEAPLSASLSSNGLLVVTASFDVVLEDYGITPPSASVVVSVADIATVEVQLYLTKAGT